MGKKKKRDKRPSNPAPKKARKQRPPKKTHSKPVNHRCVVCQVPVGKPKANMCPWHYARWKG